MLPNEDSLSAESEVDCELEMNRQIFKNPETTIIVRMDGDYFKSQGIFHNDLVVADCAIEPQDGQLVVAMVRGRQIIRRLSRQGNSEVLVTDDGPSALIEVGGARKVRLIAVVTHTIHVLPE
jgi:SOS-response transcriptional repressor LexA